MAVHDNHKLAKDIRGLKDKYVNLEIVLYDGNEAIANGGKCICMRTAFSGSPRKV